MKVRLTLFSVLMLFCFQAFSQQNVIKLDTIISKNRRVAEGHPIEKVYLHFDKPYYAVGDTIWYTAYLTYGLHQPSELSKVVYIDVISSRDTLVKAFIVPVKNGIGAGSIPLTKALFKQDSYHIKAYTKWMLNFEQAYFFNKTISVGTVDKEVSTTISMKRSVVNNVPRISADIVFKDADGAPYANKKVEWNAAAGLFTAIADGKESTDQKGLLSLNFVNSKPSDLSKAVLSTYLDAGRNKMYGQAFSLKSVAAPADVQLFPEGGNLINGIPTKIAIKAVQSNGLGADFTATVTDNTGNKVASFNAEHAGMGSFVLTAQPGKNYKVNVDFKDGSKGTYDLPKAQAGGLTMSVDIADTSKIVVKLLADSSYLKSHLNNVFYLLGKSGQTICFAASKVLTNMVYEASVPTSKFPSGIAQFTLLTSSGQPLSERIVFIRHKDQLDVAISTDKKSYGPRQKIQLDVLAKNSSIPAAADLSISVIDEGKVPVNESTETTILSSLLLTSDLKGYIENPNYYFNQVSEKTNTDLDLLMLTQGYRRFVYQDIINNKVPNISYLPEDGLEVSGTLRTNNGMEFKGGHVTLQIPGRAPLDQVTDVHGRFKFPNLLFTDSAKMVIHARNNVNYKSMMLQYDGNVYPVIEKNPNFPDEQLNIDTMMTAYLENVKKSFENSRILKEVVVKTNAVKKPSFEDNTSLIGLNSISARTVSSDRLSGYNDMLSCLQSMSLGFGVTYDGTTQNFYVARDYNAGKKIPMAISVSNMFVEVNHLASINPKDVESLEVFLHDDLGLVDKANNSDGVIVVNMKVAPTGTKIGMQQLLDLIPQSYEKKLSAAGYSVFKQFYSPKYTPGNTIFGPDLRTTLYWNSRLSTDISGKASVEFYSSDSKGTYRAVVEGLDKDGHLAHSVYRFKVE